MIIAMGLMVCSIAFMPYYDTFAERYHIGITLDKTCQILITTNNSGNCPKQEVIEQIVTPAALRDELVPDLTRYDTHMLLKYNSGVNGMKMGCILFGTCGNFQNVDNDFVVWINPEAKLYSLMDIITIRSSMGITNIHEITHEELVDNTDKINDLKNEKTSKDSEYQKNQNTIETMEPKQRSYEKLIKSLDNTINLLKTNQDYNKLNTNDTNRDIDFVEKQKKMQDELNELINKQIEKRNTHTSDHTKFLNDIQELRNKNMELRNEILELNREIEFYSDAINPDQITQNEFDKTRKVSFNVNQVYVNPSCTHSYFSPNNIHNELLYLINHMKGNCTDNLLADNFDTDFTIELEPRPKDVRTSANWQYFEWLKESLEKCKIKC